MRSLTVYRHCSVVLLLFALALLGGSAGAQPLNQRVLVVYNGNNSDSLDVANYYMTRRGIPAPNKCAITPPVTDWVNQGDVGPSIKTPIRNCLNALGPANILYIVFTYQTPYFINSTCPGCYGYAVDSLVADIWDQYGPAAYPFPYAFGNHPYYADAQSEGNYYVPFQSFADYRNQAGALMIYSVWRLDGATAAIAKGLVDKAIAAEGSGLHGQACLDRNRGTLNGTYDYGYYGGDWDLHMAAVFAAQAGFTVTEDSNPEEFGTSPAPLRCDNAALYSGWYSLNNYNDAFTWNTGAIGLHLDSASALNPRAGPNWSANALIRGITVTSGAVFEPFLEGLAHPDGVFRNLFEGANVGDAFLRNTAWLKWMILYMGDPLYRPFPSGFASFNLTTNPQNSLTFNPQALVGGAPATGTVTLANPAPGGGTLVTLTSFSPSVVSVPPNVMVPGGSRTANFPVTTTVVTNDSPAVINATFGGTTLVNSVTPVALLGQLIILPNYITGGTTTTGTVYLNDYAPASGVTIALTNDQPSVASVPSSVYIPGGQYYTTFNIPTNGVPSNIVPNLTAAYAGHTEYASFTVAAGALQPPSAVSVSPVNGNGISATFGAVYSDPSGTGDLAALHLLFNSSLTGAGACWAYYQVVQKTLYLVNDTGTGFAAGSLTPGGSGTLSNSQCTVTSVGTPVISGNTLTLPVSINFSASFAGSKNVYGYAAGYDGLASNWQTFGTWMTGVVQPPSVTSLSPVNGSGSTATFIATYTDPRGAADLSAMHLLINSSLSGLGACWIYYVRGSNSMFLVNDSGTGFISGSITPGSSGALSNSQCTIASGGAASLSGNTLVLPVAVTFSAGFAGSKSAYGFAIANDGANSNWQTLGAWFVTSTPPPAVLSIAPINGVGQTPTFSVVYSDPSGTSDLSAMHLLINSSLNPAGACWVYYVRGMNAVFLLNDTGAGFATGSITPGSPGTLANSQCTITNVGAPSLTGTTLTLPVSISFAQTFTGAKTVYSYAGGYNGTVSGWQTLGLWTPQ